MNYRNEVVFVIRVVTSSVKLCPLERMFYFWPMVQTLCSLIVCNCKCIDEPYDRSVCVDFALSVENTY